MDALDICARLVLYQAPSRCPGTLHTVDLSEAGVPFSLRGDTPGSHGCSLIHLIILHFSYILVTVFYVYLFPAQISQEFHELAVFGRKRKRLWLL